jgi:hypothetical protein
VFSKYKKIILLAVLLRLLVMPFFYHPDIKSQLFHMQYLSHGVTNIYDFVDKNRSHLPYTNIYVYLPTTYYFFGSVNFILSPLYPHDLYTWLNDWGANQNNYHNMMFFMLVLKLPYLIFDLLTGYILYKIYNNKKILYFWFFNPISIYLIYILGNFDIIPAFLTLLSFYFIKNNKQFWSYLAIGFAIALKMYPIMFLPLLLFYDKKNIFKNIKYAVVSLLPLILSILPFIKQQSFYDSFIGSGLTQKILEYKIGGLPIFPICFILILINYFFSKSKYKFEIAMTQTFLIFIGFVNFHPQWIMWFFPFIIILLIDSKKINWTFFIFFFLLIFCYIFLFDDNFLFWGHLVPIDPAFANLTSPYQLIKLKTPFNPVFIQQRVHQILLLLGLIGSIFYAKKK